MIKCIHDTCCWPNCNKTCGLVTAETDERLLIYHLQNEIKKLKDQNKKLFDAVQLMRGSLATHIQKPLNRIATSLMPDYERVCPFGETDCVYDPGYIRHYYPDWWKELGMPTTCSHVITDTDGNQYCSSYDDEDK